jgi:O-antigen/teichoic acid export membrane protein
MSAQLYSLLVITLVQIAQVPVYIWSLGAEKYGGYLLLIAVPSILTLADFGLLSATSTRQIRHVALREYETATVLSRFTNTILMSVTCLALVLVTIYAALGAVPRVTGFGASEASGLLVLYSTYALLFLLSSSFEGVYRAAGQYAWAWTRLSTLRLVDFACGAAVLLVSHDVLLSTGTMIASRVVGLVMIGSRLPAVAPWASWRPCIPRRHMAPGMLQPTIGSLAQPAANALVNQGTTVAVGVVLGPVAVVALSSCRTLANMLRQLTGVVNNSTLPQLTADLASGRRVKARADLKRNGLLVAGVLATGGLALGLLGPWVISIWTHGSVTDITSLLWILVLQVTVESSWLVLAMWFLAQNRHIGYSLVYLVSAALFVGSILVVRPDSLEVVSWLQVAAAVTVLTYLVVRFLKQDHGDQHAASLPS